MFKSKKETFNIPGKILRYQAQDTCPLLNPNLSFWQGSLPKVEHESKTHNGRSFQRTGPLAFERVYTAK